MQLECVCVCVCACFIWMTLMLNVDMLPYHYVICFHICLDMNTRGCDYGAYESTLRNVFCTKVLLLNNRNILLSFASCDVRCLVLCGRNRKLCTLARAQWGTSCRCCYGNSGIIRTVSISSSDDRRMAMNSQQYFTPTWSLDQINCHGYELILKAVVTVMS